MPEQSQGSRTARSGVRARSGRKTRLRIGPPNCIEFLDELGQPSKDLQVSLKFADGRTLSAKTNDQGRIHTRLRAGERIEISIGEAHEAAVGEGSVTPSGRHLARAGAQGGSGTSAA